MQESDKTRIYDHENESDTQDKHPMEATDDGISTSKVQCDTPRINDKPPQEHDNDSLLAEEEMNPVPVGISASMADTALMPIEEPQKRPVYNYSRSICIPYTDDGNGQASGFENVEKEVSLEFTDTIEKDKTNPGHVMISYNSSTKAICSRIAKYLKNHDYIVWIDQENITGDVFTSMASAIENSFVVLMAINEKYYQSRYCRLEAEYAVERNKPSIPMLMQTEYKPLGWLGIINGSKHHIDFSSLPFDDAFSLLLREIEAVQLSLGTDAHVPHVTMPINNQTTTASMGSWIYLHNVPEWSENDVTQWLHRERLEIFEHSMARFTGATLSQLYKIRLESPTDYHRMVESLLPSAVPFRLFLLLSFNSALESLFSRPTHR